MTTYIDMTETMIKHKQPTFHYLCVNAFDCVTCTRAGGTLA